MVDGQFTQHRRPVHVATGDVNDQRTNGLGSWSVVPPASLPEPALTSAEIRAIDKAHIWHPYSTIGAESLAPVVAVGAEPG